MKNKISIIVKLKVEGIHRWKECNIDEVSFLRNTHRHVFYITCKKKVSHQDRDIEVIKFKRQIQSYLFSKYGMPCDFKEMSCEMIAFNIFQEFKLISCEVLEDGENGAEVTNENLERY